jgi:hypothetical protein
VAASVLKRVPAGLGDVVFTRQVLEGKRVVVSEDSRAGENAESAPI